MEISRRKLLKNLAIGSAFFTTYPSTEGFCREKNSQIKHSACKWCYRDIPLEVLCEEGKKIGLSSIELLGPQDWKLLQNKGMKCAVGAVLRDGLNIANCFNRTENHDKLYEIFNEMIPIAAKYDVPNLICFSGNREGMDDETGIKNCKDGLQKVMPVAEKYKVNIIMELLNSKVNHKDYQCDHTDWGVELVKQTGSERFGLLYDIYHMQIMEGDIIRTIRENASYLFHYHTGGVPGRNEIDESQELFYPAIIKAIAETGFKGYIGQEFIPLKKDKLSSLKKAIKICSI